LPFIISSYAGIDKDIQSSDGLVGGLGAIDTIDLLALPQKSTPHFDAGYCLPFICLLHQFGDRYYQRV
jgi:hypothetical protein